MLFGDNLESVDLRNYDNEPLNSLGINKNPNNPDEMFFLTDAGMGYGDIIRVCYYAKTLARRYGKRCKIIFTILDKTTGGHIHQGSSADIVFRAEEEIPKIAKVISYYDNVLGNVDYEVVAMSSEEFSMRAFGRHIPFLLPTRTLAVTNWLGVPFLQPNDEPEKGNHIAVWTTKKNLTPVGHWKDPIGPHMMEELFGILTEQGHDIRRISYRDSVEHVFETIRTAKFCIGYEGIGNLISQSYSKPCLIYSQNEFHSKVTSGMWAEVASSFDIKHKYIDDMIRTQEEIINRGRPNKSNQLSDRDVEYFKRYL